MKRTAPAATPRGPAPFDRFQIKNGAYSRKLRVTAVR